MILRRIICWLFGHRWKDDWPSLPCDRCGEEWRDD